MDSPLDQDNQTIDDMTGKLKVLSLDTVHSSEAEEKSIQKENDECKAKASGTEEQEQECKAGEKKEEKQEETCSQRLMGQKAKVKRPLQDTNKLIAEVGEAKNPRFAAVANLENEQEPDIMCHEDMPISQEVTNEAGEKMEEKIKETCSRTQGSLIRDCAEEALLLEENMRLNIEVSVAQDILRSLGMSTDCELEEALCMEELANLQEVLLDAVDVDRQTMEFLERFHPHNGAGDS